VSLQTLATILLVTTLGTVEDMKVLLFALMAPLKLPRIAASSSTVALGSASLNPLWLTVIIVEISFLALGIVLKGF
jgi:hypothetical protein